MIAFLKGTVVEKNLQGAVLDVDGVGYDVMMSTNCLAKVPAEGKETSVYTYLHVREDLMQLFGFCGKGEKELFEQLISVSGIGPKVALAILSAFSITTFKKAILSNDVDLITAIPGIGKKSAQRLVLELKEKISLPHLEVAGGLRDGIAAQSVYAEAREALIKLGYSAAEANESLEAFPYGSEDVTAEELVKHALKNLVGG